MNATTPKLKSCTPEVAPAANNAGGGDRPPGVLVRLWRGPSDPSDFKFRWWHLAISATVHVGLLYLASVITIAAVPDKNVALLRLGIGAFLAAVGWHIASLVWCAKRAWSSRPWFEGVLIFVAWILMTSMPAALMQSRWERTLKILVQSRSDYPADSPEQNDTGR